MRLVQPPDPIADGDDVIRDAVRHARVVPLLAAVARATGDLTILRDELRPDPARLLDPDGGVDGEQAALARRLALEALARFRDGGSRRVPSDPVTLRRILSFLVGDEATDDYLPLFREELAVDGEDPRAPDWHKDDLAPGTPLGVAVIGAGMSGIAAGHRLRQAGVPFVILEKDDEVGGTWYENTYPGCRVDVANHFYSYSFAQRDDWPQHFSTQDVLLDYFRACADHFGLRPHIRWPCEVRYVLGCLKLLLEGGHRALDCRPEVHDAYNERIDDGNLRMAWGVSDVNSWYKDERGRVAQNWPFSLLEFWRQTRVPDPGDYVLT